MEVSVTKLNSFENIYFHFLSEMFDFAQSLQRNEKENLSRFPVWQFIDPFFSFELATHAFSDFSYKNKTKKIFNSIVVEDFVNFCGLFRKHKLYKHQSTKK